jgi:hypothetical protein
MHRRKALTITHGGRRSAGLMLMARWTAGAGSLALVAIGAVSAVTGFLPGLGWALVVAGLALASRLFRPDADGLGLAPRLLSRCTREGTSPHSHVRDPDVR